MKTPKVETLEKPTKTNYKKLSKQHMINEFVEENLQNISPQNEKQIEIEKKLIILANYNSLRLVCIIIYLLHLTVKLKITIMLNIMRTISIEIKMDYYLMN